MSENGLENMVFVSDLGDIKDRPDLTSVDSGLGVRPHVPKVLSSMVIQDSLREAIKQVGIFFDSLASDNSDHTYLLDEVELTLQVTQSGKVAVFLADVGGAVQGGIKMKWKRKAG